MNWINHFCGMHNAQGDINVMIAKAGRMNSRAITALAVVAVALSRIIHIYDHPKQCDVVVEKVK